ncbi:MAG: TonB-dependent receptor [Chryseolinea sp.]
MCNTNVKLRAKSQTARNAFLRLSSIFLLICHTSFGQPATPQNKILIRGKVEDGGNGETIVGANVLVSGVGIGTTTNASGEYFLRLSRGRNTLTISFVGYQILNVVFDAQRDTTLLNELTPATMLQEIVVTGELDHVQSFQIGQNILNISALQKIPPLLGEPDIVRGLLLMPGVSTVGEGATGFNVRGGAVDQNLILLDDAPVFNTSHLFGFITAFSSTAVSSAELYKGGLPINYGGRVASVLDVKLRQGNKRNISGRFGVGILATNLTIEGPILSPRTTFLVSGRVSYSNWLLNAIQNPRLKESKASFYDGTVKVTHDFNKNHKLSFTSYTSHDHFKFPGDTTYGWSTQNFSLKALSTLRSNVFLTTTLVSSNYKYIVSGNQPTNEFDFSAGIGFRSAKIDATWAVSPNIKLEFGAGGDRYSVALGQLDPVGASNINGIKGNKEYANVTFGYVGTQFDWSDHFTVRGGMRLLSYQLVGPGKINEYTSGQPRSEDTFTGTASYSSDQTIQRYARWEPRVSMRYKVNEKSAFKLALDQTAQFIHVISNTSAVSPVDLWKLSDPYLKPQKGRQVSIGYFRSVHQQNYELSLEAYYKHVDNVVDYKDGGHLLLNDRLEADLLQGIARSYGVEAMLEKKQGKITGWLSYTLSRTERRIKSSFPEEQINSGKFYPASYDKPHVFSATASYQVSSRVSWGFNFVLYSGRPITYPTAGYTYQQISIANFEQRNNARTPAYHRLDLSLQVNSKSIPTRKWKGTWVFSLYNVYARKNPYSIFFRSDYFTVAQPYRLSVIGMVVPSVSYTISF